MDRKANSALIQFLLKEKFLTEAAAQSERERDELLALSAVVCRHDMNLALVQDSVTEKLGFPWIELLSPELKLEAEELRSLITEAGVESCRRQSVLPFRRTDTHVYVAMANPFDVELIQHLSFVFGRTIRVFAGDCEQIRTILTTHSFSEADVEALVAESNDGATIEFMQSPKDETHQVDAENTPETPAILKLTNQILLDAVERRASDVHLEPVETGIVVRYRIDGTLFDVRFLTKEVQARVCTRFKILAGMDIAERRKPQDGRIRIRVREQAIDIRASAVPTAHGEAIVLRLLSLRWDELSLDKLGMSVETKGELLEALKAESGLILVTGPTGSGKTTTLYACLVHLRDGTTNIITVEDPVEYRLKGLNQIQVHEAIGLTFAKALRSVLRQDPDIVLIGEIRDEETARIAIQAAQTGHLVLATLHTNDAVGAVTRLLDLGADALSLSEVLRGVLAQRLVRRACTHCAKPLTAERIDRYRADPFSGRLEVPLEETVEGMGCPRCGGSGYHGRIGIFSFLSLNPTLARLVLEKASPAEIREVARRGGYLSLRDVALELLRTKQTTFPEIRSYLMEEGDQGTSAVQASVSAAAPAKEGALHGTTLSVLLVDPNEERRAMVLSGLVHHHFHVRALPESPCGRESFADVDVLVCDGELYVQSEALRHFAESGSAKLPVVALESRDMHEDIVTRLRECCVHVLPTNRSVSALAKVIREVVGTIAAQPQL